MTSKWETVKLGDLCKLTKGSSPTLKTVPGPYPLVVTGGERKSSDSYQFDGEAVCVPMVSSTGHGHASLKRVHYESGKFAVANIIVAAEVLDPEVCDTKYLFHYLQCFKDELIVPLMKGTANVSLSQKSLATVPVAIPPLAEQRRIVDLIGALDDAIEAAEERVSAAQTAELQVLDDLVGKPENSQSRTIGELFDVIDCEHKTAPESQTDIFAYSVGTSAIRDGAFRLDRAKPVSKDTYEAWTQRAAPASGDVVLTREAPVGEVALVTADLGPICLGQRTVLLRQKAELPGPVLWAALRTAHYQSLFTQNSIGLTVSRINIKAIKLLKLPELDPERIDTIGAISTQFLNEIESAQEVVASLRTLRTELLTALLSGAHEIPESYDSVMELADA